MKKLIAVVGVMAVVGAPAIFAATRPATPAPQQVETIVCPLTGEDIEPCCCPLNDEKNQ